MRLNKSALVLVSVLANAALLAAVVRKFRAEHRLEAPLERPEPPQSPAPSTEGPPPVCTHEVCAERPRYLRCDGIGNTCRTFEVLYEHHCACDAWRPGP